VQHAVLIQREFFVTGLDFSGEAGADLGGERIQPAIDPPDVFARAWLVGAVAPDRLAFHKFRAQHGAFAGHPVRQKRVAERQFRDCFELRPLAPR
jgi:hypothetical protein